MKITIAGAGIGGLAASIALAKKGHAVTVAERASEIAEVGAGLQISPNGRVVLNALGLADTLDKVSIKAQAVVLMNGTTGREVTRLRIGDDLKARIWSFVHRAALIDLLHHAATEAGVQIDTGREITPPGSGAALPGDDLLIGADGLHSKVRGILNPSAEPFFTHQVAWRAVIDDPDPDAAPEVEVHMGPRRHLVSYPLIGGRRNIVAVEERTAWAEEGWSHQDDPANLRTAFDGLSPRAKVWLARVEHVFLWGLFRHPVARNWGEGRQVLLGDAAHPTLPFLAQGANLALEDAWALATALEAPDTGAALNRYQAARAARAQRVVDASTKNAQNYHLSFPPLRFAAHSVLRLTGAIAPGALLNRFEWLYGYDVTGETI